MNMFTRAKILAWLVIPLCVGGSLRAEDKVQTPSQKTKEAVDKLKTAPSLAGKTLQDLGKAVSAKLGVGAGAVKTAKVTTEAASPAGAENDKEEGQSPVPPAVGKRDPFRPFTLNNTEVKRDIAKLSPLERYELGQLKLVGIVWAAKQPNAMVEDAAGLGYVVRIGTPIGSNEGKVKTIQPGALVVEEFQFDVYGAKKKIERRMSLATEKAE